MMRIPPPNPHADEARAAMREYSGTSNNAPIAYHLTWPASQPSVYCIDGQ